MSGQREPAVPTGFGIQLLGSGEGALSISFADSAEQDTFMAALQRRGGRARVDLVTDQSADTQGHALLPLADVLLRISDEDDTEGHAISVHFPSAREADDFRKRLLLAGVLAGTVVLGAVGVAAIPASQGGATAASGSSITDAAGPADMAEAFAIGATGTSITDATGPSDLAEALAIGAAGTSITDAAGPADMAEASAIGAAGTSITDATGPSDLAEAMALEAGAAGDQDSDTGIPWRAPTPE
jgi:hypothetical protein